MSHPRQLLEGGRDSCCEASVAAAVWKPGVESRATALQERGEEAAVGAAEGQQGHGQQQKHQRGPRRRTCWGRRV